MNNNVRHINQSILSDAEIKAIASALAPHLKELNNDEVMTREQAAEFLEYAPSTFDRFVDKGLFRCHRPNGHPRFLKSELIEDLKKM